MREPSVLVKIAGVLDGSFHSAFSKAEKELTKVRQNMASLDKTSKALSSFKDLSAATEKSKLSLLKNEEAFKKLNDKIHQTGVATEFQSRRMSFLGESIEATKQKLDSQITTLEKYKKTIHEAGLSSKNFEESQSHISNSLNSLRTKEIEILSKRSKKELLNDSKMKLEGAKTDFKKSLFKTAVGTTALFAAPVQYQHQMTRLLAATKDRSKPDTPESEEAQKKNLSKMVLGVSENLPYSPTTIAREAAELSQAGFSVDELKANLPSIFKVSLATDSVPSEIASMMRSLKSSFGLNASSPEEMNILANSIAKTVNMTAMQIEDLKDATPYLVNLPKSVGMNLGDTLATMGALKERGIPKSIIGTSLVALFNRLSKPKTQEKLSKIGVKVVTSKDGKQIFRPILEIIEDIAKKMKPLGNAQQQGFLTDVFETEAGRSLGALVEDINDKLNSKLRIFSDNLRVLKNPKFQEKHLELDYLDKMKTDLQKSYLNELTQVGSKAVVTSSKIFESIEPELFSITKSMGNLLDSFNRFLDLSPSLTKSVTMIAGGFVTLSLALKALSVLKWATIVTGIGGLSALGSSSALLLASSLGYLTYQNWDKITKWTNDALNKTKEWSTGNEALKNYVFPDGDNDEDEKFFSFPKTTLSQPMSKLEDNRIFTFNLEIPQTKDPHSYVNAIRESVDRKMTPLRSKAKPFFDRAEVF